MSGQWLGFRRVGLCIQAKHALKPLPCETKSQWISKAGGGEVELKPGSRVRCDLFHLNDGPSSIADIIFASPVGYFLSSFGLNWFWI